MDGDSRKVMNVGGQKVYTGIVSGKELEDVSKAIFASASSVTSKETTSDSKKIDYSKFNRVNTGIDLFEKKTSIEDAQNIAKSKAGLGIELSKSTTESLNFLRTEAAKLNSMNSFQKAESRTVAEQNIFQNTDTQALTSQEMNSDREGSNPFSFFVSAKSQNENKNEAQSISIFA